MWTTVCISSKMFIAKSTRKSPFRPSKMLSAHRFRSCPLDAKYTKAALAKCHWYATFMKKCNHFLMKFSLCPCCLAKMVYIASSFFEIYMLQPHTMSSPTTQLYKLLFFELFWLMNCFKWYTVSPLTVCWYQLQPSTSGTCFARHFFHWFGSLQ